MDILVKPVTEEDEYKWGQLLREEMPNQKSRTPYAETLFYDLAEYVTIKRLNSRMSYAEMKHTALQNIINLEKTGKITRQNGYQDLLNSIATDIRTKHRRRIQRQNELESTRHTLAQLEEKAEFLKEQLSQYEAVIDQNKKTMQTNKGYRPTLLC
jgi:Ras GTPase-activating-like protein IQGAP2/3